MKRPWLFLDRNQLFVWLGLMVFSVPLFGYMLNGTYMRYSGDDYCYAASVAQYGFWKAQWLSYTQILTYNGNRFSLTLFAGLADLIGPKLNGLLPAIVLVSWWLILTLFVRLLFEKLSICSAHRTLLALWVSGMLVFFTLYQTPDVAQSLYWRSGMLPYFAPLVVNSFLGYWVVRNESLKRGLVSVALVTLLAAWIGGGFSETGAMFQASLWGMVFLTIVLSRFRAKDTLNSPRIIYLLLIILAGTLIAILMLVLSPTVAARNLPPPEVNKVLRALILSGWNTLLFFYFWIKGITLPLLVNFVIFLLLGVSGVISPSQRFVRLLNMVLLWVSVVVIIFFSMLPFAYIQSSYPESRALAIMQWVATVLASATGVGAGAWISRFLSVRQEKLKAYLLKVAPLALVILCFYPVYASRNIYNDLPRHQKWATFWDKRDAEIRDMARHNVQNVQVIQIDHIIPNVGDLSPDPEYWYNRCASIYYGVKSISAGLPGWDEE
ncbi:MAG: hypothetical protein N3A60_06990 [Thermanaerothrix sp.]|nr:hypothetical protein [Thermanaerothrix sp.]